MTDVLCMRDHYLRRAEAVVRRVERRGDHLAVMLDRTIFHTAAGGQPPDRGTLAGLTLVDVVDDHGETVHLLPGDTPRDQLQPGNTVALELDWPRRFDIMQQHTGQHLLSALLFARGIATKGAHMGLDQSTVDLDVASLDQDLLDEVERAAFDTIIDDLPLVCTFPHPDELQDLPLRRDPAETITEAIRVVAIGDLDMTPCCGTHLARTGELGMIKIVAVEKAHRGVRLVFVAGHRALDDYRRKHRAVDTIARAFSASEDDIVELVLGQKTSLKETERRLAKTTASLLEYRAEELVAAAERTAEGLPVVLLVTDKEPIKALEALGRRVVAQPGGAVALFASTQGGAIRLVFMRSEHLGGPDVRSLLEDVCAIVGGSGGGKAHAARGGGKDLASLEGAMTFVTKRLIQGAHP